jgi:hypothetical protein
MQAARSDQDPIGVRGVQDREFHDELPGIMAATREELSAAADAAAAELRLASVAVVAMLVMGIVAAVSLATAWTVAMLGIGALLISGGYSPSTVLFGIALVHLGLGLTLWWGVKRAARHLQVGRFLHR